MMRLRRSISVVMCLAMSFMGFGQQHNHWFMGFNAGLDFSTGTPVPTGGSLSTDEGCASIADSTGQLLFFTNGEQVWDRNQNVMPNGTGLNGSFSSSQSALIVPMPGAPDLHYIFTTPAEAGTWGGTPDASYSIVDMSLNGGLGEVTIKNINLVAPVTERLTATRHANGQDVWVLYHEWDSRNYHAFLVTCDGVEGPVTSSIGYRTGPDAMGSTVSAIGCMKLNRQGTRLASVWTHPTLSTAQVFESQVVVDVMEFDNATGVISNLLSDTIGSGTDLQKGYGVEFSPNGDVLYVNEAGIVTGGFTANLYQYDMLAVDPMSSRQVIHSGNPAHGSMQIGPDGAIYIARLNGATYLSKITSPNVIGPSCGYQDNGASLGSDPSTWGLPNHWDAYSAVDPIDLIPWTDSLVCGDTSVDIDVTWDHPFHVPAYLWSTGETSASITVTGPGEYSVEVFLPCSTLTDTVWIGYGGFPIDLGEDRSICEGQVTDLSVSATSGILWSTGDTTSSIRVEEEGTYSVSVEDSDGCISIDEVLVEVRNCDCPIYVPNALTPNGDGINDMFRPEMDCQLMGFQLFVYDRWGREVFSSIGGNDWWDPQNVPLGVYVYKLDYSWLGYTGLRQEARFGHVTVVR